MFYIGIIFAVIGVSFIIFTAVRYYKIEKIMMQLEKMVDDVIAGNFNEHSFDESQFSKLESKTADFLTQSNLSAKNVKTEHSKIKTLIADISHQTKTPVANIVLYSQLLGEQDLPKQSLEHVKQITTQGEKLSFLLSALVKLSYLENGIITVNPIKQDIVPMILDTIETVSSKAKEKNISLKINQTSPIQAIFDCKWTSEAIVNVLDNAIKYTDLNGRIDVNILEYEMFVRIDITDNGIGISEGEISKIFMRFYRSPNVSEQEGVGIGLYLVRSILRAENGYIKVSSQIGKGTTFSIFLICTL